MSYTDITFTDQAYGGITAKKLNKLRDDLSTAISSGGGGTGTGDMLKSVYDTNNNGVVDSADAIGWTAVTGKPATFPASAHGPTHLDNGTDPIPVVTVARTGLTPILSGNGTTFLSGDGLYRTPVSSTEGVWNYSTTNTMVDPGAGKFRTNTTGFSSATAIAISDTTTQGTDRTAVLSQLKSGDVFTIQDRANAANFARYSIVATPTNNATWFQIPVSWVEGGGAAPNNNTDCIINFSFAPQQQAPLPHASTHLDNGTDAIAVVTATRTGLAPKLSGSASVFLDGTGNWSAPAGVVNPGTWTTLSFATGWSENTTARYRVETNGAFQKVICEGIINYASGAAALAFTLPAGARPSLARGCALAGYDLSGDVLLFSANIATGGAVTIYPIARQAFVWPSATNGSVYLDNLTFAL